MIECPNCGTRYRVEVPVQGHKMRCARCAEVWHAFPIDGSQPISEPTLAPAPSPSMVAQDSSGNVTTSSDRAGEASQQQTTQNENIHARNRTISQPVSDASPSAQSDAHIGTSATPNNAMPPSTDLPLTPKGNNQHEGKAAVSSPISWGHHAATASAGGVSQPRFQSQPHHLQPQAAANTNLVTDKDRGKEMGPVVQHLHDQTDAPSERAGETVGRSRPGQALMQAPKKLHRSELIGWSAVAVMVVMVIGSAAFFRNEIVRILPGMSKIYALVGVDVNTRGLAFRDVRYRWDRGGGTGILTIEGKIVNITNKPQMVPPVLAELRDRRGFVFYRTNKMVRSSALGSGEASPFILTINSPPHAKDVADVRLHFRMDLL